ncbi:MAG TPA: hypothetical protein VFJ06_06195 [Halococcus sp.]|nr:hypothetical protein [Halococcus sp.]
MTTANETDSQDSGSPTMQTTIASETDPQDSGSPTVRTTTAQSNHMAATSAESLDVQIEPAVVNARNVKLVLHSTATAASATNGIESITVDTGGGLDLSNVTVANVNTAGIDDGGTLPSNRIDGSLARNVKGGINVVNDGERFIIPFDGNRNIEQGDEIVFVIEGGITTEAPGSYTFALTINDGPTQTDTYNITAP